MRGWKRGLWLMVLPCSLSVAIAEDLNDYSPVEGTFKPRPKTDTPSSADALFRQDASAEEDYQAGIRAYDRNELIEAQGIFERAGRKGHTGAMTRLAEILDRSGFVAEAAAMYLKAAQLGNIDAQYSLGQMYLDLNAFDLTHTGVTADPAAARKWFQLAAEGGHQDAINIIYGAYLSGGLEISDAERTDAEVLKWVKRAIDVNQLPQAMDTLALAYREGKYGLGVDLKLADEWAAKARKAYGIKEDENKKKKKKRV